MRRNLRSHPQNPTQQPYDYGLRQPINARTVARVIF